jgi:hypothetical protein
MVVCGAIVGSKRLHVFDDGFEVFGAERLAGARGNVLHGFFERVGAGIVEEGGVFPDVDEAWRFDLTSFSVWPGLELKFFLEPIPGAEITIATHHA